MADSPATPTTRYQVTDDMLDIVVDKVRNASTITSVDSQGNPRHSILLQLASGGQAFVPKTMFDAQGFGVPQASHGTTVTIGFLKKGVIGINGQPVLDAKRIVARFAATGHEASLGEINDKVLIERQLRLDAAANDAAAKRRNRYAYQQVTPVATASGTSDMEPITSGAEKQAAGSEKKGN